MEQQAQHPNAEMALAWDGPEGDSWTDNEDWYNAGVRYISPHLFAAAAIRPADRVLDVGSGCGETTRLAGRAASSGAAFGIDLSSRMIERARERARLEGLANVQYERGDAQAYLFEPQSFEIAISRFGVMFFDDPIAAFSNIAGALVPGGRLVMLVWDVLARNEWLLEIRGALAAGRVLPEPPPGAPGPLALADPDRVRAILDNAGFGDVQLERVEEPVYFGPDAPQAFDAMGKLGIVAGLVTDLDEPMRVAAFDALRRSLVAHETPDGVHLKSSSWLVRASKRR